MYSWQCRTTCLVRLAGEVRPRARASPGPSVSMSRERQLGPGLRTAARPARRPGRRPSVVGRSRVGPGSDVGLGDDQDRLADVVEDDHPVEERERRSGRPRSSGGTFGQVLGVADRVVGRVARRRRRRTGGGRADAPRGSVRPAPGGRRNGSAEREPAGRAAGRPESVTVTSWPRASNRRNGSVPRKLNRPTFSPPMTLSNRNDGAVRSIRPKAETGRQAVAGQLAVDRNAAGRTRPSGGIPRRWAGGGSSCGRSWDVVTREVGCMDINSRAGSGKAASLPLPCHATARHFRGRLGSFSRDEKDRPLQPSGHPVV